MKQIRWSSPIAITAVILAVQTIGLWGVGVFFVVETVTEPANSLAGAIFLDILIFASAAAMSVAVVWFIRGVSSTRSAVIVWQMTVIGIGIASAQGTEPQWGLAVALIAPATVVTILMLFSRKISRHLDPDA